MTFWRDTLPTALRLVLAVLFPCLIVAMVLASGCAQKSWSYATSEVSRDVVSVYAMDSTVIVVRYQDVAEPIVLTKDDVLSLKRKVP